MSERVSYPVIVEYSQRHIVWIEASSPERAAERVASWPYDVTKDQDSLADSGVAVRAPKDRWDWEDVYGENYGSSPYTTEADAHVEAHEHELRRREERVARAACAASGHPETKPPLSDGRIWCVGCVEYLPAGTEVAPC